jgi:hypothetical protein
MIDSAEYMFSHWPHLWVVVTLYAVASFFVVRHLLRPTDCFACSIRRGLLRSALLAGVVTPSLVTDFWVAAFPAPAMVGFLFAIPDLFFGSQPWALLRSLGLLYVLPWVLCSTLIFAVWLCIRRRRMRRTEAEPSGLR